MLNVLLLSHSIDFGKLLVVFDLQIADHDLVAETTRGTKTQTKTEKAEGTYSLAESDI